MVVFAVGVLPDVQAGVVFELEYLFEFLFVEGFGPVVVSVVVSALMNPGYVQPLRSDQEAVGLRSCRKSVG
jgi:hypothetical protein